MTSLQTATRVAHRLIQQFTPYVVRIEIAGSVRRGKADVKDLELVAIPRYESGGMFGDKRVNLLNRFLDKLVEERLINNCFRGDNGKAYRWWGSKFRKFKIAHESGSLVVDFFQADADNFGSMWLIRTGPAEFSKWWVTELLRCGYRHSGGRVNVDGLKTIPTPDEETCFKLVKCEFIAPEKRMEVNRE